MIQLLLPQNSRALNPVNDRLVLNGISWRIKTGAPWAEIPSRLVGTPTVTPKKQGGHLEMAALQTASDALGMRIQSPLAKSVVTE